MLKKSKLLLAVTLAVMVCFASITAVFAATNPQAGKPDSPAQAGITKILQTPVGT